MVEMKTGLSAGRRRSIEGEVVHGRAIGRTIGFPTANIASGTQRLPTDGIFASISWIEGSGPRPSVSYVGRRPTVNGVERQLEVFILDFSGDLYGRQLKTTLIAKIRGDLKFSGLEELKAQIQVDCGRARQILARWFRSTTASTDLRLAHSTGAKIDGKSSPRLMVAESATSHIACS